MKTLARSLLATRPGWTVDLALFLLRLAFGGLMLHGHGLVKLRKVQDPSQFPDPLGIGGTMSFYGAIGAEVVCAAMIVVGLLTRLATLPLIFAMAVAAFVVHANDPFYLPAPASKEPAVVYLLAYVVILIAGPGRWSIDGAIAGGPARASGGGKR
jgi:putative oxidoreductase